MYRFILILALLVSTVAAPLLLRRDAGMALAGESDDRLVIITAHSSTIRAEYGEAFARHWTAKTGRRLYIDWRMPGGTAEIRRVLDSSYAAAQAIGNQGVGIDVIFGGAAYEFVNQAAKGRLELLDVFETHPEWFREEVIPEEFTGERFYDKNRRWVGVCLFQLGICYNSDVIERLGLPMPRRWEDLGDPAYAGHLAFADPTKSGSVAKAIEMIVQEQMQRAICEMGDNAEAREEGWRRALNLLQRLAANARYFTDSATQVPYDVAQGNAAAGMCIDYYGRSFEEKLRVSLGSSRLRWTAPEGGGSVNIDPVAILRGAPRPDIAKEFVAFCLSDEGQLLWDLKVGEQGGPRKVSLRRLPVRRDVYTAENLKRFADASPYGRENGFVYRRELTASALQAITALFRAMCIDPHEELKAAWLAMGEDSGGAAGCVFSDVSQVSYERLMNEFVPLFEKKGALALKREMSKVSQGFRENYQRAQALAGKEGSP
ncbi:ABC transporter substrate-binding protein [Luteolibacter soli]|uniref:Extracellular solute-binding protein n=1 Tax=Luteolibacter soli TaxID=3135280 RepID=A0ABU9AT90_9BACT